MIAGRSGGGGVLLGRVLGGPASVTAPAVAPRLAALGARYAGAGRGFAYGVVDARCAAAVRVRFVATPRRGGGRTIQTRVARVSGAYGREVVCAALKGLVPGGSTACASSHRSGCGARCGAGAARCGRWG